MSKLIGKVNVTFLFILIQVILYAAFLFLDISGGSISLSSKIKFTIIVICLCYVLFYPKSTGRSIFFNGRSSLQGSLICLQAAIMFTMISDIFILLTDYYMYGLITFIIAHQLHSMRLTIIDRRNDSELTVRSLLPILIFRFLLQVVTAAVICAFLIGRNITMESLLVASVLYFVCILTNVILSIKVAVKEPSERSNLLFAAGMILFLLCDINVAFFNLSGFIEIPERTYHILYAFSSILMWTFYAPSQVLLSLSAGRSSLLCTKK
ncbi:MAG: lysoplasmalogenase family protein [Mobilitalea sp.]